MGEVTNVPAPCSRCKVPPVWGDREHSLKCPVCQFKLKMKDKKKVVATWNGLMRDRSRKLAPIFVKKSYHTDAAAECREDARKEVASLNGRMLDNVSDLDE